MTQELRSPLRSMDDFYMYFLYILIMCAQHFGDLYPIYLKLPSKDATMLFNIVNFFYKYRLMILKPSVFIIHFSLVREMCE